MVGCAKRCDQGKQPHGLMINNGYHARESALMQYTEFISYLLGNTSASNTVAVGDKTYGVYHFEGGDFTYEVIARLVEGLVWDIQSINITAGMIVDPDTDWVETISDDDGDDYLDRNYVPGDMTAEQFRTLADPVDVFSQALHDSARDMIHRKES